MSIRGSVLRCAILMCLGLAHLLPTQVRPRRLDFTRCILLESRPESVSLRTDKMFLTG